MSALNRGEGIKMVHGNKKINVNPALAQNVHEKLDRLAVAIGVTKTSLAAQLIELCLNTESIINFIQQQYQDNSRFRIIPSKLDGGEVQFVFAEKKKQKGE